MGSLLFRCPRTDREVDVGIHTDSRSLSLEPFFALRRQCPACGETHHWHAMEGRIDQDEPGSRTVSCPAELRGESGDRGDSMIRVGTAAEPQTAPRLGFLDHVALRAAVASTQERSRQLRLRAAEQIDSLEAEQRRYGRIIADLQAERSSGRPSAAKISRALEAVAAEVSPERRELAVELLDLLKQAGVDCELWIAGQPIGFKTLH
jgi:hypothetical protein